MGILGIVWRNLTRTVRTRRPDDMVPRPPVFRGLIEHEVALCTGCHTCAYVCAPNAITLRAVGDKAITWNFFAGQCSFCGLCVQYCPTGAITNRGKLPPVTGDQRLHRVTHEVELQRCAACGRSFMPMPEAFLRRLSSSAPTDAASRANQLCDACRRRTASRHLRDAFIPPAEGADHHARD